MASGRAVARSIRLFADQTLSPAALSSHLAATAVQRRDALIARGDAPSVYATYVDGRQGVPETAVRPDGRIVYRFNVLGLAATFALAYCTSRSPVRSGRYRRAWAVIVDGKPWRDDLNDVPAGAEIMIVNPEPYARKIDTGAMKMSVPPGIIEGARQTTRRKFPTVNGARAFVKIPAGLLPGAPYTLKTTSGRRRDRQAGQQITYPALILTERR